MPEVESQAIGSMLCRIINGTEEDFSLTIVSEPGDLYSPMRSQKFMCEIRFEDQAPQEIILVAKRLEEDRLYHFVWLNVDQKPIFHPFSKDIEHIPIRRLFIDKP